MNGDSVGSHYVLDIFFMLSPNVILLRKIIFGTMGNVPNLDSLFVRDCVKYVSDTFIL